MERYSYRRNREGSKSNPSFSSSLLDEIYRSFDEGETMRKKQHSSSTLKGDGGFRDEEQMANFQRLRMIEKWMEKETEKVVVQRRSLADFVPKARENREILHSNSSWSSSDSSSGGGFSSSEAENSSSCYGLQLQRPKNIKTSVSIQQEKSNPPVKNHNVYRDDYTEEQKPKNEGNFLKKKSRALKIYGDLKKAKQQPISPGGKLASFLNSLFSAGNGKNSKIITHDHDQDSSSERKIKSLNASTCSSASSFSRSCLSKTPSSRGKASNGMKRSVRFYPVSVIVDEDCQPCGQKSLYEDNPKEIRNSINEELQFHIMEKNRRVEEAAKDLLRNYQKRVELEYDLRTKHVKKDQIFDNGVEDEDEEDDAASYASSDLFELDNLSAIGMERYREELPVYETTYLDTNRAIANGIIL